MLFVGLAACPGSGEPGQTGETAGDESSSSGAPDGPTSGGPVVPTSSGDTGTTEVSSDSTDTGAIETSTGEDSGTTDTTGTSGTGDGGSESGTDDTGAPVCEVSWAVPEVSAEALGKHDLAWVGCEFTSCGAEDQPIRGESSVLCSEVGVAEAPLEYLGKVHINETGVFSTDDVVSPSDFPWLDGARHIYRYDDSVLIMTVGDEARDQLEVFFTVRALEVLRTEHTSVYEAALVDTQALPEGPPLDGFNWKNRLRGVVISFDDSPLYIAAGLTVLDEAPTPDMGLDIYNNVAAISIDSETILGASAEVGSRPIYGAATDDENFLRYLREGLAETIVHELLHTRVDRLNSVDEDMSYLWDRRGTDLCGSFELEETLVAASSLFHFRDTGAIGSKYLDYYDAVLDANLAILEACPQYDGWVEQFGIPSGLAPRYDLRLLDL